MPVRQETDERLRGLRAPNSAERTRGRYQPAVFKSDAAQSFDRRLPNRYESGHGPGSHGRASAPKLPNDVIHRPWISDDLKGCQRRGRHWRPLRERGHQAADRIRADFSQGPRGRRSNGILQRSREKVEALRARQRSDALDQ